MKPNTPPQSTWRMSLGLGAQLVASHLTATVVALTITNTEHRVTASIAAIVTGIVLTLPIQRTLWLVNRALANLNAKQHPTPLPTAH